MESEYSEDGIEVDHQYGPALAVGPLPLSSGSLASQPELPAARVIPNLPALIPMPVPILPSLNGFLVIPGVDWYIRDTTSAVQFKNTCPIDYMLSYVMIRGHTSPRFRALVDQITHAEICLLVNKRSNE